LINAAHSIPVGHADLNIIEVKTYMNDHHEVVAEIKDSGCGMSPSVQKRIFDPFYTTKPMGSGTGLGLAICQSIVNQFHGAIAVESVEGKGTTFREKV
uniref:sensor histidine kinase n=1 Tax=Flavobacterium sp. TaxID=239 RepID=UPI00374D8DF1